MTALPNIIILINGTHKETIYLLHTYVLIVHNIMFYTPVSFKFGYIIIHMLIIA